MILIDANLLIYAIFRDSVQHDTARDWLDATLSGTDVVALPWAVIGAFIRLSTNQRVMTLPLSLDEALGHVEEWIELPNVRVIVPTPRHKAIFADMLRGAQAVGNLVSDAHLAALAVEHGCWVASTNEDFARFPGLIWANPLQSSGPSTAP